jgi:inosose dehydratase
VSSTITIGTAPDSWGVWFPNDPEQVPSEVFLREVAEAGYQWIELGPYGYLPTDPAKLSEQLDEYGMGVLAGTVFEHLHRPDSWDAVWTQVTDVAALTQALGGKHIVVIPEVWRHHKTGEPVENRELTAEQWKQKTSGLDELGRRILRNTAFMCSFTPTPIATSAINQISSDYWSRPIQNG